MGTGLLTLKTGWAEVDLGCRDSLRIYTYFWDAPFLGGGRGGAIVGTGLHTPIRANVYPPYKDTSCRWTRPIRFINDYASGFRRVNWAEFKFERLK